MKKLLFLTLLLVSSPLYAGKIVLMPEVGRSEIDVDAEYTMSEASERDGGVTLGVTAGYKIDSVIVAANFNITNSDNIFSTFDNYRIYDRAIFAGYSFNVAKRLRIVPIIGINYWKLVSKEGRLFNPGSEEQRVFDGVDMYGRLNFEIPLNDLVQLNLSYVNANYDFGRVESLRFGVKFEF